MNATQRRVHVVVWVVVLIVVLTIIVLGSLLRKGPRPVGPSIAESVAGPSP